MKKQQLWKLDNEELLRQWRKEVALEMNIRKGAATPKRQKIERELRRRGYIVA